jgi:hypothetical protein
MGESADVTVCILQMQELYYGKFGKFCHVLGHCLQFFCSIPRFVTAHHNCVRGFETDWTFKKLLMMLIFLKVTNLYISFSDSHIACLVIHINVPINL